MRTIRDHSIKNPIQRRQRQGLRLSFVTLIAIAFLTGISAWAGSFSSTFPGPNPPAGVTLYPNALILPGGGLQLNQAAQGNGGSATITNLDGANAVMGFSLGLQATTANGGGGNPADGWGVYFSTTNVVPVGSSQNYEALPVPGGIAMQVDEFQGQIDIEVGSTTYATSVPRTSLVGNVSANFSYDPIDGAVLTFTGSDKQQYVVSVSAAQLGLSFQPGDNFIFGGRVGYPGASSADSHTINSLSIKTFLTSADAAPVISGPADESVGVGQAAQFGVTVESGAQPISYQWLTNGVADPAGTNANYVLASPTLADNGRTFQVIVTNSYGSVPSTVATLTVSGVPIINTQPASKSVAENSTATFTVEAASQSPLYYQWYTNGVAVAGATSSTYVTPPVHPTPYNGMQFTVVVTNSLGRANSQPATLTVVPDTTPPAVTAVSGNPSAQIVTVDFSKSVTAATALDTANYQLNNGASINGASFGTNNSIVLLQTTSLLTNEYILHISGVQDQSQTPNVMAATNVMFFATPVLVISDTTFQPNSQPKNVGTFTFYTFVDPGEYFTTNLSYLDPFLNAPVMQWTFNLTNDASFIQQNPSSTVGIGIAGGLNYATSNAVDFVSTNLQDYTFSFDARLEGLLPGITNCTGSMSVAFFSSSVPTNLLSVVFNYTATSNWTHFVFNLAQGTINSGSVALFDANISTITNIQFTEAQDTPYVEFGFTTNGGFYFDNFLLTCVYPAPPLPIVELPAAQMNFDNYPGTAPYGYAYDGNNVALQVSTVITNVGVGGSNGLEENVDDTPLFNAGTDGGYSGFACGAYAPVDSSMLTSASLSSYKCYFDAKVDNIDVANQQSPFELYLYAPDGTTGPTNGNSDLIIQLQDIPANVLLTTNFQTFSFSLDQALVDAGSVAQFAQYYNKINQMAGRIQVNSAYNGFNDGNIDVVLDNVKLVREAVGLPALSIGVSGGQKVITWSGSNAVLESSTNVAGPYVVVPGAMSPYTIPAANSALFYRTEWLPAPTP